MQHLNDLKENVELFRASESLGKTGFTLRQTQRSHE